MTNIENLDQLFNFFPPPILKKFKSQGGYEPILNNQLKSWTEIYSHLSAEFSLFISEDYTPLLNNLANWLAPGPLLHLGCQRGELLKILSQEHHANLYGLDSNPHLIAFGKRRLQAYKKIKLLCADPADFDYSRLPICQTILIYNFWTTLNKDRAYKFLEKIKNCLNDKSRIIIGPYEPQKCLLNKYHYPFWKFFPRAGYVVKIHLWNQQIYFQLKLKSFL